MLVNGTHLLVLLRLHKRLRAGVSYFGVKVYRHGGRNVRFRLVCCLCGNFFGLSDRGKSSCDLMIVSLCCWSAWLRRLIVKACLARGSLCIVGI